MICTEVAGMKRILVKIVLPVSLLAVWMITCYPICRKAEGFDFFLYWVLVGCPYGIRKMCMILIPKNFGIAGSIGILALNCIVGGLIGGVVVILRMVMVLMEIIKINRLEDNIAKHYPQQITILKERISGLQADIQTAKTNLPADKEFFSMRVGNKVYTDKKEAGTALVEMCKEIKSVNAPAVIGEYAGFKMAVSFDSFNHKFVMNIKGQLSHNLEIGVDPLGNISRINHALEAMTKELAEASTKLENVERQLETAKVEVTKPFAQEAELSEKLDRLSALNALLNMDEKGDDGIGMEDDKSELGTEQVADTRKPYPIENTRHNYAVENGNPQGMRLTAAMADKPAQRVSLKEKLETMKVKAAGNNIENSVQRDKGKEEYL